MPVIAIVNHKGGVGKTTTTVNLGAALQELGHRVLLLDLDPQASLTIHLGIKQPERLQANCGHVLMSAVTGSGHPTFRTVLIETPAGLSLIPSGWQLADAEALLGQDLDWPLALRECLAPLRDECDYVLVDCLPSRNRLVYNALAAADYILIPVQTDYLAFRGLAMTLQTVATVQRRLNPQMRILGILMTMVDLRTRHSRQIVGAIRRAFHGRVRVFDTVVKLQVAHKDSSAAAESILRHAAGSSNALTYLSLARELTAAVDEASQPNRGRRPFGGSLETSTPAGEAAAALADAEQLLGNEMGARDGRTQDGRVRAGIRTVSRGAFRLGRNGSRPTTPEVCPYLGLEGSRFQRLAAPADSHRCWAGGSPSIVDLASQEQNCLQAWHWRCGIYMKHNVVGRPEPRPSLVATLLSWLHLDF